MSYVDYLRPSDWGYEPGKTIVVIGPALGGPASVPLEVRSAPAALFGGGPLVDALQTGLQLAPDMHWIGIRLNGVAARAVLPALADQETPTLIFESVSATDAYNGHMIVIAEDLNGLLTLTLPGSGGSLQYRLADYSHIAALAEAINRDALYGRSSFWVYSAVNDVPIYRLRELLGSYTVVGGNAENQLTKDDLFLKLSDVLALIDGRPTDAVVVTGLYFDDKHDQAIYGGSAYGEAVYGNDTDYLTLQDADQAMSPVSYHGLLAEWCSQQAARGRIVTAFLACRPLFDPSALITIQDEYVRILIEHVEFSSRISLSDRYGRDIGRFLQLICGEGELNGSFITLEIPAVVHYLRSAIDNSTNVAINLPLYWELDAPQRIKLAEHGVMTFYTDPRDEARIWSGVTAAPSHSDWHWSINLRQVQIVIAACLDQLDKYIGNDFRSVYLARTIDRDIESVLKGFRSVGVVSEYRFSVEYIPLKKEVILELSLLPKYGVEAMQTMGQVTMG